MSLTSLRRALVVSVVLIAARAGESAAANCRAADQIPGGIYAASSTGEVWRITPMPGTGIAEATFVGITTDGTDDYFPVDIAFDDAGVLYGVDGFALFCLSPIDASTVFIGDKDEDPPYKTALAGRTGFHNKLYGGGESQLFEMNPHSAKAKATESEYGSLDCGNQTGDVVFDPYLDILYGTTDCFPPDASHLVIIDAETGLITETRGEIRDTTGTIRYGVFGLAFGLDGALYAGTEETLMRLDPATGHSLEDFQIVSVTPGESFDRVDGLASRVCPVHGNGDFGGMSPRTAGQWRQECPSLALAPTTDPMVAVATVGNFPTTCQALQAPEHVGLPTNCELASREYAALALNLADGRLNPACGACSAQTIGVTAAQLALRLEQAITDEDARECNAVKREAHQLNVGHCSAP